MASVLTRLSVSNDTGTPASPVGDGTLINAALLTTLQDNIDALLSVGGSGSPGVFTIGADLTVEGFGTHTFSAAGTGANIINIRNTSAGTGNYAEVLIGNDATSGAVTLRHLSSTYTTSGMSVQDGAVLAAARVGGLSLAAYHASGAIRLYTGGTADVNERMRISAAGIVSIGTTVGAALLNMPIGGATADSTNYGRGIQITGPTTNFGQMIALVRQGAVIWSLGYAYNTSTLAIGQGQATDSNFTAAAAALTITSANEVQAPQQPCFLAYNSSADAGVSSGSVVDFDTEVYDVGGGFAADVFTAPVAGYYIFDVCLDVTNPTAGVVSMFAVLNASNTRYIIDGDTNVDVGGQRSLGGALTVYLAAAGTAKVEVYTSGASADIGAPFTLGNSLISSRFGGRLLV